MSPSSTPPLEPDSSVALDGLDELLADATELAIGVARRDAGRPDGTPPPPSLKPYLRFSRFPPRARTAVLGALGDDSGFRERVAETAQESALSRASWLFLTRPDGWAEEFDALRELALQDQHASEAARREQSAQRRLVQVAEAAEQARTERDGAIEELDEASATLEQLRQERTELLTRLADLTDQRAEAVRQLKDQEALAVARLEELQELRVRVAELEADLAAAADRSTPTATAPRTPPPSTTAVASASEPDSVVSEPHAPDVPAEPAVAFDPTAVAAAIAGAARDAAGLATSLAEAAAALQPAPTPPPRTAPAAAAPAAGAAIRGRVPQRMRSGVIEDSAAGILQLMQVPGQVVIIDGYNVSMEGWPQLDGPQQRDSLVDALGTVQARGSAVLHVVFDGVDSGGRPLRRAGSPVRVHFTDAATEADDRILSMVERIDPATPVTVISSDRRVSDGARALGANTARSSSMLSLIRS